jgi:hypothetical protein
MLGAAQLVMLETAQWVLHLGNAGYRTWEEWVSHLSAGVSETGEVGLPIFSLKNTISFLVFVCFYPFLKRYLTV